MRQLYLERPGKLRLRDAPVPVAGPGEVIIRVRAALTCGTDVKTFRRGHPKFPMPMPFGHEFSGDVHQVGEGLESWSVGQPVMLAPTAPCLECVDCARGLHNLCAYCMETMVHGAFAEYVRVPAHIVRQNLYPKPEELDYFHAAILEPLACVVYGSWQVEIGPKDTVVVIGAGPIGLLHQVLARRAGAGRVVMMGRRERRLAAARRLGADLVVEVGDEPLDELILEHTGGQGASVVIECTGRPTVWESCLGGAARGGSVLLFGGCAARTSFDFSVDRLLSDQVDLKGAFHFNPDAVREAHRLLVAGDFPAGEFVTEVHPLSDYQRVFEELMQGEAIKFGLQPDR